MDKLGGVVDWLVTFVLALVAMIVVPILCLGILTIALIVVSFLN